MEAQLITICHIYLSRGHNFFGHHGEAAGAHPVEEVRAVECVEGRGLAGDRFFGYEEAYKGQVTFFAMEVYDSLCARFGVYDKEPSVLRRNIVTAGVDLNDWIGEAFEIQGVRFLGTEEAKPCYWMDQAFCPGAKEALRGQGGLRARIVSSGTVRCGSAAAAARPVA